MIDLSMVSAIEPLTVNKVELSIVVLNFNANGFVKRCVESVLKSDLKGINCEIVLVDNNSYDGSQKQLISFSKNKTIEVVLNSKNYGFSKGNNIGAKKTQGKYVLFLNPDTFVKKDTLKNVYWFMERNQDVGVSCPRLDLPDGTLTSASHRGFPTPWNALTYFTGLTRVFPKSEMFAGYTKGWLLDNKNPHEVDSISGGFFFVRRKAAEEVGWWDEDYFLYGEDIDFCFKLKQRGWKVMFLPNLSVLHYHGVSSGIKGHSRSLSSADKETRIRAAKASTAAMRIFYEKHYKDKYPPVVTWLVLNAIRVLSLQRKVRHSF